MVHLNKYLIVRIHLLIKQNKQSFCFGYPMPGVVVKIQNKKRFIQTDKFGKFSIDVKRNKILVFSFIGSIEQRLKVNSNNLNVVLERDKSISYEISLGGKKIKKRTFFGRTFRKIGNWFR